MVNGIQAGGLDLALDDSALDIAQYRTLVQNGQIGLTESQQYPELGYTLFNTTIPPFNNIDARLAFAYAVDSRHHGPAAVEADHEDRERSVRPRGDGIPARRRLSDYDPVKAKFYVQKYEQETGRALTFTYLSPGTDAELLKNHRPDEDVHGTGRYRHDGQGARRVAGHQHRDRKALPGRRLAEPRGLRPRHRVRLVALRQPRVCATTR